MFAYNINMFGLKPSLHNEFAVMALKTAFVFVVGIFLYDILKVIEKDLIKGEPERELEHMTHSKLFHFAAIFLTDLLAIYVIYLIFRIKP
jgi:hypothetical protein